MKDKIWAAIRKMKPGKAPGTGSISVKILKALEDYRIDKIATLLNKISISTFKALLKKAGATECGLHRPISLLSHQNIIKIHLRIILIPVRNRY